MRALLSFFTVYPAGRATLEDAARSQHLLPLLGLFTGLPGVLLLFSGYGLPAGVAAALAFGAVLLAAGLHHTDGLLDVGDALMVRGTPERRREAMKDLRVGVGGVAALFLVYGPALPALSSLAAASPGRAALALLAGEVAARSAMLLMLAFGRPAETASSSAPFVAALKTGPRRYVGLALALALPALVALPLGAGALAVVLVAPLVAAGALRVSGRAFGGIGGDATGATGELTRTLMLLVLSAGPVVG
ncbi:MAG: adenosylcobinamide-GDP ribazoletransferase [Rubrobacter sp.]|nr:adenosylcobinamide-GDP ribazoletransferase [Rubrobacter sp.]